MIPRLTGLTVASAALALLLLLIFQSYFSDVLPLAATDMLPPPTWRFQGAFVLSVAMFLATAVSFMSVLGLIALIGKRYLPRGPRNS